MADLLTHLQREATRVPPEYCQGPVSVAVSGGPDSTALLHLLARWCSGAGVALRAIHIDHQTRPTSGQEAESVRALCERLGVPCQVVAVDVVAERAARRAGFEDAARVARYRALVAVAQATGSRLIALGHHATDQVETVLLHLLRGAGTGGLTGMAPLAPPPDPAARASDNPPLLWRPLLAVERAALVDYCRDHALPTMHDVSNDDHRLARNRLRHLLLPVVEREFPGAARAIARAADLLALENDFLDAETERAYQRVVTAEPPLVRIARAPFRDLHPALRRRLARRAWAELTGGADGLARAVTDAACELIARPASGARLALPREVLLVVDRTVAHLGPAGDLEARLRARTGLPLMPPGWQVAVAAAGEYPLAPGWAVRVVSGAPVQGSGPVVLHIPLDITPQIALLTLKTWEPSQYVIVNGNHRKLQDWFTDQHIPRYLRDHLVVLALARRVLWIVGLGAFLTQHEQRMEGPSLRFMVWYHGAPWEQRADGEGTTTWQPPRS